MSGITVSIENLVYNNDIADIIASAKAVLLIKKQFDIIINHYVKIN